MQIITVSAAAGSVVFVSDQGPLFVISADTARALLSELPEVVAEAQAQRDRLQKADPSAQLNYRAFVCQANGLHWRPKGDTDPMVGAWFAEGLTDGKDPRVSKVGDFESATLEAFAFITARHPERAAIRAPLARDARN